MDGKLNNVFISHIHEDDDRLNDLKSLLAKNGRTVRDSSITSDKPNRAKDREYIRSKILAPAIDWASVVIVLISPGTRESDWVDWEIEYAHQHNKRVIGVWDHGDAECDVPDKLDECADAVVGWRADQIIDAIDGKIDTWRTPTGEVRPERNIARHQCTD